MDLSQEGTIQVVSTNPVEQVEEDLTDPEEVVDSINPVADLTRVASEADSFLAKNPSIVSTILFECHK